MERDRAVQERRMKDQLEEEQVSLSDQEDFQTLPVDGWADFRFFIRAVLVGLGIAAVLFLFVASNLWEGTSRRRSHNYDQVLRTGAAIGVWQRRQMLEEQKKTNDLLEETNEFFGDL